MQRKRALSFTALFGGLLAVFVAAGLATDTKSAAAVDAPTLINGITATLTETRAADGNTTITVVFNNSVTRETVPVTGLTITGSGFAQVSGNTATLPPGTYTVVATRNFIAGAAFGFVRIAQNSATFRITISAPTPTPTPSPVATAAR